jgi:hypothetical protein
MMLLYSGAQQATLTKAVTATRAVCPLPIYVGSYVDDKWLILPIASLEPALQAFIQPFQTDINQIPELSKFRAYSPFMGST